MKFYTSDLHIGHKNIIAFDNRPFSNLDDMHETIINNWNSVVTKSDDVYILGDFAWRNNIGLEVLKQLKGNKHLILGNHDRLNSEMSKYFVSVKDYEIVKDGDKHIVLFHFPIAHWQNADYGYIHLYGHIHAARDSRPFEEYKMAMLKRDIPYECYNVGCMLWDYKPVTLEQIRGET
jgi:calcineurin-like phosphoesterase family protein